MSPTHGLGLSIGAIFQSRYEILSELGQGSFGQVYKARQRSTGQTVAVKLLRLPRQSDAGDVRNRIERFRRETRLCAELSHPNIVRLIDSGEAADGALYTIFEFVPGATLKDVLLAEGQLGVAEAVHLMTQVLDALSCAHASGVVHRDLKPENIMVTRTGARRNALVLDFGLGGFAHDAQAWTQPRITATHEVLGTPCYAAPEQLRGEPPSTRSDLYSWGLILLECLTGDLPVRGASAQEVIMKQLGPEPVPIPHWLRNHPLGRVLELATAKRLEKRDIPIDRLVHMLATIGVGECPGPSGLRPNEPVAERGRRQLTIVCCRLTISSGSGRQPDIEEIDELLEAQRSALAERAARSGGAIATVLAERVFLVFGYPQAREDDARRATRLAVAIAGESAGGLTAPSSSDLRVDFRIGVHTGLVIVRDVRPSSAARLPELTGLTPQIASQLVERAGPGEVLVSVDTVDLLRHDFDFEPAGDCAMSELSRPLPVFRVTGVQRSAASLDSGSAADETPLVGRASQLQQLCQGWANASAGHAGVVVITGEAGIGKSRLLRELRRHTGPDAWLGCRCAPENQTTALRPAIDLLLGLDRSVESLLTRYGLDLEENLPLFTALLSIPLDDRYEPLHLSAERQKELTLRALVDLLFRIAEERAVVLAIENLHWADPTTIELVTLFIQELQATRSVESEGGPKLFLVFTTRPDGMPAWSGLDVAVLPLQRLVRADVEEMVKAGLARERGLPAALLEQVVQRTDGVPLFVEEVTRLVLESTRGGDGSPVASISSAVEIPARLRDLLTARLDRVSAAACETAQLAAVLGREFGFEILRAVSPKDIAFLREDIAELGRAGLVLHRRSGVTENYVFRHALLRDAAYETMTRTTRQELHRRVAQVLQRQFPDIEQARPEIVALHFEQGGEDLAAAGYWRCAGDQALRHAAYVEATRQLERGLGLLQGGLPDSRERSETEIELLTSLGTVQFMTKGYAAAEVEQTFAQAWERCERLGADIPLKVLHGIWAVEIIRSNREAIDKLIPRVAPLALCTDDPVSALSGHGMLGANAFWRGHFREANEHLTAGRVFYHTPVFERFARDYGYDGGLDLYGLEACTLWQLGFPDRAEALRCEMLAIAERSRNPHSLAAALAWSTAVTLQRGAADTTIELSQRLNALASEQHLYSWLAIAACALGGALLQQGDAEGAFPAIQQGLALYQGLGVLSSYAYYLTYLAAAHLAMGHADDGLGVVDEGESLCDRLVVQLHRAELLRLKGELLLLKSEAGAAESYLRCALDLARQQDARSYQLRAAMSLSRLLATQHQPGEAHALLRDVYGWFTEGFETKDLRAARALFDELSA
jgi:TOMM system kinase/cyclase fusion protein